VGKPDVQKIQWFYKKFNRIFNLLSEPLSISFTKKIKL